MPGGGSILSASLPKTGVLPFTPFDSRNSLLPLSQQENPEQILAELNQMPFLLENETSSDVQGVGSNWAEMAFSSPLFPKVPFLFGKRALLRPKLYFVALLVLKTGQLMLRLQAQ